ncbi:MAG: hypothetical protein ACRD4Q_13750 [Candidatus Acidiferrales bacterium]
MLKPIHLLACSLAFAILLFGTLPAEAQGQTTSKVPITTTVTVLGPKFTTPPPIAKDDISVYSGKTRWDVLDWSPAQGEKAGLQMAIVIDNSASQTAVGTQLNDLASFVRLQSKTTAVGIFYAVNGTVQTASNFSTNHEAVAKTLRLPFGLRAGASPSVYLSLSELVKHWPATGARREILLISSGVDRLDRGPQSPYVQSAVDNIQKAGIVVHTIYTGTSLRFGTSLRGQYAQQNLDAITSGSGGEALFQGVTAPVSFSPYLKQLDMVLHNQYLLTFAAPRSNKRAGELREIRVRVEQRNVDIKYSKQVLVPGPAN